MSRNMMIGIAVVVIAVAGIGAYMAFGRGNKAVTSNTAQSATSSGNSMMQGSIQSLLGAGKNVTCDITYTDGKGSGTIYVSSNKFRGDFNTTTNGKTYMSHMISDGTTAYVWSDNSTDGTKMNIAETKKMASGSAQTNTQATDLNAKVAMKCSAWAVDNSKLTPPANIKFTDISAMMNKAMTPAGGNSGTAPNASSYCNSITDPQAKAACVSAMSGH
jgi:hypothetical protein